MIFKRTRMVKDIHRAIFWVDHYVDEISKHRQETPENGLIEGDHYLTGRPKGAVTAHGYVRPMVYKLMEMHELNEKQAVKLFLHQYGAELRKKKRTVVGLRAIASLKKHIVPLAFKAGLDLDNLLVQCLEITAENLSTHYYRGQMLGFFVGIHHDKDHIHGHLLILPYTEADKRISMSNRSWIWRATDAASPGRIDLLDAWREEYGRVVSRDIYCILQELQPQRSPLSRERKIANAQAQLAADRALSHVGQNYRDRSIEEKRDRLIASFVGGLHTSNAHDYQEMLDNKKQVIVSRISDTSLAEETSLAIERNQNAFQKILEERRAFARQFLDKYRTCLGSHPQVFDHITTKYSPEQKPPVDMYSELLTYFAGQRKRRKTKRIGTLSSLLEANLLRLHLGGQSEDITLLEQSIAAEETPYLVTDISGEVSHEETPVVVPRPSPRPTEPTIPSRETARTTPQEEQPVPMRPGPTIS